MRRRKAFSFPIAIIIIALFVLIVIWVSSAMSKTSVIEQKRALESAILRDVVHCYAIEGAYPESLDYIKDNYGLTYNEELFFVDYTPIASNIMPDITIIEKAQEAIIRSPEAGIPSVLIENPDLQAIIKVLTTFSDEELQKLRKVMESLYPAAFSDQR